MKDTSPSTATSNNRGGRPKDWTEERTRKLVRLYVYTSLSTQKIVDALANHNWKPKKDAASKWLNQLLGHDPRWAKPKTPDEEEKRMAGLRASCHRSKRRTPRATAAEDPSRSYGTGDLSAAIIPHEIDKLDDLTLDYSRSSSLVKSDASILATPAWFSANTHMHSAYEPLSGPSTDSSRYPKNSFFPMSHLFSRSQGERGTKRQDSSLTNSTDLSVPISFKAKLGDAGAAQIKFAYKLIKRYTIPKDSEGEASPSSMSPSTKLYSQSRTSSKGAHLIVPGDFLQIDLFQQAQELPNLSPDEADEADESWLKAVNEVSLALNLWPSKGHCSINSDRPWATPSLNPTATDDFGNTIFHFLAARHSQRALVDQLLHAEGNFQMAIDAKNTAGQTFLHVLNQSWFEDGSSLRELLEMLNRSQFDILAVDVYGRNLFHLLQENEMNHERMRQLALPFTMKSLNRRDAFDRKPMNCRSARRIRKAVAIHRLYPGRRPRLNISTEDPASTRIRSNTDLLKILTAAIHVGPQQDPDAEDTDGRNGFHCLAEVVLGFSPIPGHPQSPSTKRKREDDENMESKFREGNLSYRLELLQSLINAHVDVNHYDKLGQTPLMAFVKHTPSGTQEDKTLRLIFTTLVRAGANMEARNRQGETALYMAARLGRGVALKQLIDLGANVYVRNAHGLHIVDATHQALQAATNDTHLYGRLHSCCAILTGQLGARWKSVTALDEWRVTHS